MNRPQTGSLSERRTGSLSGRRAQAAVRFSMTSIKTAILLVCLHAIGARVWAQSASVPDMDLRFAPRLSESGPTEGSIAGSVRMSSQPPAGLEIELDAVDPARCTAGQEVAYDVRLRNISSKPLLLPWATMKPQRPAEGLAFASMKIRLGLDGDSGSLGSLEFMWADDSQASSRRRIEPGRAVLIRVPAQCELHMLRSAGPARGNSRRIRVVAEVTLVDSDGVSAKSLRSAPMSMVFENPAWTP